ncbi:MAG: 3-dehydroquinate synthase [Ktedonobacteraceae bacterium]|nr:3-dehydroquinate synthase [Ktedonobacteraceae bacterium]
MRSISQTVQLTYNYSVYFTDHLFASENRLLQDVVHMGDMSTPRKILCVIDSGVLQCHPDLLNVVSSYCQYYRSSMHLVCSPLVICGGEYAKNDMLNVTTVQEAIHRYGICRHSYVMAIGGGALIDMVGYAAATAHRGVRLIRVPTTVLAQNDSGVGVKNSINSFGKKNFLGTFAPPVAVLNDAHFLTTLSTRDWLSGISEAVKVALLKDGAFFAFLEKNASKLVDRDMQAMSEVIYRCAQLHLEHIATSGDPFETGSSRPLDFGHWAAHKLEQLSDYMLRHGEAVAIGIALDSTYSYLQGRLPERDWQRILDLFLALGLAIYTRELSLHLHERNDLRCIFSGLQEFREHLGGQLTLPLLECIGHATEIHEVDEQAMIRSIALLEKYQAAYETEKR